MAGLRLARRLWSRVPVVVVALALTTTTTTPNIYEVAPMKKVVLAMAATAVLLAVPAAVNASARTPPTISGFTITPASLPATGGSIYVTAHVKHASRCAVVVGSGHAFWTPCATGYLSTVLAFPANRTTSRVTFTVHITAYNGHVRTWSRTLVDEMAGAAPPPRQLSPSPTATLSVTPSSVPATGGSAVLSFSSSHASSCTLSSTPASPAFSTGANPTIVTCNGTYTATLASTTTRQRWSFTFTATNAAGQSASATRTLTERAPPAPVWTQSPIWSGYVVSSSTLVTDVSGAWTVPTLNCAVTPNGGAFIWAGIGGYGLPTGGNSGTLLQTGIRATCINGLPQYAGWFEEYPSTPNTSREFSGFPVSPGDSIEASVFQGNTGAWVTRVDDLTTGLSGVMVTGEGWGVEADSGNGTFSLQGSTTGLFYSGGYTAEWIVEDYSQSGAPIPFADYGTVTFTDLRTSMSPWYLTPTEGLAIAQSGVVLSTPSLPANDSFSISYRG
jgi:hypothetical protein